MATRRSQRPKRRSVRPQDLPIYLNPVMLDFEKRRISVAPNSMYVTALEGGDDLVNATDLATITNLLIEEMEMLRLEMAQVKLHLASMSGENISEEDVEIKGETVITE